MGICDYKGSSGDAVLQPYELKDNFHIPCKIFYSEVKNTNDNANALNYLQNIVMFIKMGGSI